MRRPAVQARLAAGAERRVWLTFDDGPHPEHTPRVLDALKANGIPATFFVIGRNVERHGTDLLKRARDEGHGIGNHSYSHPRLTQRPEAEIREELGRTDSIIAEFHGEQKLFRPPYGDRNALVLKVAKELGYWQILWNIDPRDFDRSNQPDRWVQLVLDRLRDLEDAVILLHDIQRTTAEHVPLLLRQLRELGPIRFEPGSTLHEARDAARIDDPGTRAS